MSHKKSVLVHDPTIVNDYGRVESGEQKLPTEVADLLLERKLASEVKKDLPKPKDGDE